MARLVGFIANRPDLCNRFAEHERRVLRVRGDGRAPWSWGIGFFQSGEVLLKRRPIDERPEVALADMIAEVRSDVLVASHRTTAGALSTANTPPFRYAQWLFANTGTEDRRLHERLHGSLPPFLQRAIRGETDGELVFHLFLSFLHDAGKLDHPVVTPVDCTSALKATMGLVDRMGQEDGLGASKWNILLACPDYLLAIRRGAPMGYRVLAGREALESLYEEQGPDKLHMAALEPCRLAVVASDFDGDDLPDGWTALGEHAAMAFTRTDAPVTVARL